MLILFHASKKANIGEPKLLKSRLKNALQDKAAENHNSRIKEANASSGNPESIYFQYFIKGVWLSEK